MIEDSRHSCMLALTSTAMKMPHTMPTITIRAIYEDFHSSHSNYLVINVTCGTDVRLID